MNERIQELAERAKGFVDLNQHVGGGNGCMVYTYDGIEKFAELIVQECIKIAYQNDVAKFTRDGYVIGQEIEKHFGVE